MKLDIQQNREELTVAFEQYNSLPNEVKRKFSTFTSFLTDGVLGKDGTVQKIGQNGDYYLFHHRLYRYFNNIRHKQRREPGQPGEISTYGIKPMEYAIRILISDPTSQQKMLAALIPQPPKSKDGEAPARICQTSDVRPVFHLDEKTENELLQAYISYVLTPGVQKRFPKFGSNFLRNCRIEGNTFSFQDERGTYSGLYRDLRPYTTILGMRVDPVIKLALGARGGPDVLRERILARHSSTKSGSNALAPSHPSNPMQDSENPGLNGKAVGQTMSKKIKARNSNSPAPPTSKRLNLQSWTPKA